MNYIYFLLLILILIPILPPKWFGGAETFLDQHGRENKHPRWTILRILTQSILSPLIEILALLALKGAVTLIIFIVIGLDFYFQHSISNNALVLVVVGIISLYFESMLEKASKIKFFHIFEWESRDKSN